MIRRNVSSHAVDEGAFPNRESRHAHSSSQSPLRASRQSYALGHHFVSRVLVGLWMVLLLAIFYVIVPSAVYKSTLRAIVTEKNKQCQILETASEAYLASLNELDLKGCHLLRLPTTIQHCTQLQKLDISDNPHLTTLPDELRQCTSLDILFSSSNPGMKSLPTVLGQMSSLTRLGWRSGALTTLEAVSLPPNVVHLILTNNQIQHLNDPAVWERLQHVRKLMLSHNQITSLSTGVFHLRELELLRLAGNQLTSLPDALWSLPKLTWLTISGNPGLGLPRLEQRVPTISLAEVTMASEESSEQSANLGAGASGSVTARIWQGHEVAVKTIHGVTSDGRAEDELQMYGAVGSQGMQHRVVGCLAVFQDNGKSGVVMERIPADVDGQPLKDLALAPTIREVTVDRWQVDETTRLYDASFIRNALVDAVNALLYLHGTAGVAHGDFYAHNIKVDKTGHLYLLDLGASWATGVYAQQAEKLEVRAFGILVQELLERQQDVDTWEGRTLADKLTRLAQSCLHFDVNARPSFVEISRILSTNDVR